MGAYNYQALSKQGASLKGVIEADSERQARQLLRDKGLVPLKIQSISQQPLYSKNKLSSDELALFTRQLATLLSAGIPVEESLLGVSEQTSKHKVRELISGVRAKVLEGYSLAQAMSDFPRAFPELYCATIGAGEHGGNLDQVLTKLADYTEAQQSLKQKLQHAFIYPVLMLFISGMVISFLLAFVVPNIIEVFASNNQSLPVMTNLLIAISVGLKSYGLYGIGLLILAIILFKRAMRHRHFKERWHKFLLSIPFIAYFIKTANNARYIHTFAILFASGVNVLETMKVAAKLINNLVMQQQFDNARIKVQEGANISSALKETGFLSMMTAQLIANGEKSGQLAVMMERAALHLDEEIKRLIAALLTLLEPMIILMMGLVVLFIVLATLLPIFSMDQLIN